VIYGKVKLLGHIHVLVMVMGLLFAIKVMILKVPWSVAVKVKDLADVI
jgi:hypothetical protein